MGRSNPKLSFVHRAWTTVDAGQRPGGSITTPKFTGSSPRCAQARGALCTPFPHVVHRLRLRPRPSGPSVTSSHRSLHGRLHLGWFRWGVRPGWCDGPSLLAGSVFEGGALVARGAGYEDF